jgi:ABC-type transport system substrate-binding protein
VDQAKALLKGTPCDGGCSFKVLTPSTGASSWQTTQTTTALKEQLKDIGIDVEIVSYTTANAAALIEGGDFGLSVSNNGFYVQTPNYVGQTYTDPTVMFGSSKGFPGTPLGTELKNLSDRFAPTAVDSPEMTELVERANQLIIEDNQLLLPMVVLSYTSATSLPESVISDIHMFYLKVA